MMLASNFIERKAIDILGRLGSLYDASYDRLVDKYSVKASNIRRLNGCSICKVFSGDQSIDLITYLKEMDVSDDLQQSILLCMVNPSGVSSLVNHNRSIHDNSRFLYYSYRSKEEELNFTAGNVDQIIRPPSSTRATHMITKIVWGIEILCIIPISNDQSVKTVDNLLESISNRLQNSKSNLVLSDIEKRQIAELINVTIYGSETCVDNPNTSLLVILNKLQEWQKYENFHHPLMYTMHSLRWLYKNDQFPITYNLTDQIHYDISKIQIFIIPIDTSIKDIQQLLDKTPEDFSDLTLNQQWTHYKEEFYTLLNTYNKCRERLKRTLSDIRRNSYILSHEDTSMTIEEINAILKCSLAKEHSSVILWYSSDQLKRRKLDKWEEIYEHLILERQKTKQETSLIYVDFSPCTQKLNDFSIVHLPIESTSKPRRDHLKEQQLPSASSPKLQRSLASSLPSEKKLPSITEINVLLMGETGVGKSTFINAFVNYLIFDTLEQAQQNDPVVLIPVSFLITTGDQFNEFIVKFGDIDSNENYEHQGQSVTQQCKSYIFKLNEKLCLRLIDTPSMGDTRGLVQDEISIDHILTYVNNLSHLNAICLLFKPNDSRLNMFFGSCVNQLLMYLTPIFYNNIIFCFTNARSTFFAPGNTGSLLREMFKQEHLKDIPFEKKNTFCFDSESFRYLAARKCHVDFNEFVKQKCINNWTRSVAESVRLLRFILNLKPYNLNEWQSIKKASLEISILARPLMETLRLILYNWKLHEVGLTDKEISSVPTN
ncbi:unnamed protein product [Rotaria sordida]|uniref:G domain-containing protein n=1 Tax=Rotaria sordida TaxID=392033 RepID=A0A819PT50_9BILA|nr:unnamed protein product [Rotaria sordida]